MIVSEPHNVKIQYRIIPALDEKLREEEVSI